MTGCLLLACAASAPDDSSPETAMCAGRPIAAPATLAGHDGVVGNPLRDAELENALGDQRCVYEMYGAPALVLFQSRWHGICAAVGARDALEERFEAIGLRSLVVVFSEAETNANDVRSFLEVEGGDPATTLADPDATYASAVLGHLPAGLPVAGAILADEGLTVLHSDLCRDSDLEELLCSLLDEPGTCP